MTEQNLLKNVYLFKEMSPQEIVLIDKISVLQAYEPHQDIFCERDPARALYVIKSGSVRIHQKSSLGDNIEIAILGSGSHFGEMALLDSEKRSATATAMEKSEIVIMDFVKLKGVLESNLTIAVHFYHELALFLCGRLRVTTNDLSFARERNLSHF